jgi:hypothetical protein
MADDYSIDARAALRPDICVPCQQRGHICPAHCTVDNERWCLDCTEGNPCVYQQRNDKSIQAGPLPAPASPNAEAIAGWLSTREHYRKKRKQQKAQPSPHPKGKLDMHSAKKCSHPECETPLTERNKSGYCAKHFYYSKKNKPPRGARRVARKSTKADHFPTIPIIATRKSAKSQNGTAVATICVTEANLNAFWQKLSIDEKADLFMKQLGAN